MTVNTAQSTDRDEAMRHSEGRVARTIEERTARLPSDAFLWASVGAMGVSAWMHALGRREDALFVGQWVAPFLLFGIYNKLVKIAGSDRLGGDGAEHPYMGAP
jgi:hypothetical protein